MPRSIAARRSRRLPRHGATRGVRAARRRRSRAAGIPVDLKEGVLEKIGTTGTPQPVLAVARLPAPSLAISRERGAVGRVRSWSRSTSPIPATWARSCAARRPPAPRESWSAAERSTCATRRWCALRPGRCSACRSWRWPTAAAALDACASTASPCSAPSRPGGALDALALTAPVAFVVGNEARGLNAPLLAALDGTVTIPMAGGGVAQRGDGHHRPLLRSRAAARRAAAVNVADDARRCSTGRAPTRAAPSALHRRSTSSTPLEREHLKGRPPARGQRGDQDVRPERPPRVGQAVGAYRGAGGSRSRRGGPSSRRPPTPRRPRRPRSTSPLGAHGRGRGHLHLVTQIRRELEDIFVGLGLPRRRRSRGRGRLAQLRGAQHPARAPGPLDAGHDLRRASAERADAAAHAHVAGADPHDGDAAAADLRGRAGPRLPQRDARRPPLARVPPDRGPRRRPRPHDGRPLRHHRGVRAPAVRRRVGAHALPLRLLPLHRAVGRARGELRVLRRRRLSRVLAHRVDRARRLRDGRPQRVRRRSASTPRSGRASRSASASSASR